MAFTQADVDTIKKAIASGVARVDFSDGRRVDYRTVADLKDALALAQADVTGNQTDTTVSYASFSKD